MIWICAQNHILYQSVFPLLDSLNLNDPLFHDDHLYLMGT